MKFSRNKVALKWEWCHNKAIYQGQLLNMWSVKIKLIIGFMRWVTTVTVTGQSQQCKFWIDFPVHRNFWQFLYIKHCRFLHVQLVLFCFVLHEFSPELLQSSPTENRASFTIPCCCFLCSFLVNLTAFAFYLPLLLISYLLKSDVMVSLPKQTKNKKKTNKAFLSFPWELDREVKEMLEFSPTSWTFSVALHHLFTYF